MSEKQLMLVAVACRNASGEPDMPVFEVEVDDREQEAGYPYELAETMAGEAGYEGPYICFDHSEQSSLLRAVKRLSLVPSLVVIDNSGGAIHGVSCDDGQIDVLIYGDDLDGCDEDLIEELPVDADGSMMEVWVSRWTAEPGELAQTLADLGSPASDTAAGFVIFSADEDARSQGEAGYWSNADGWVDQASATVFSQSERDAQPTPLLVGADAQWLDVDVSARPRGWRNPAGKPRFITDLGADAELRGGVDGQTGAPVMLLDRYGVWGDAGGKKAEVIALGNDLEQLAHEHGIEAKAVVLAGGERGVAG